MSSIAPYRADPMWGMACSGFHLQYRFSEADLARISEIQNAVETIIPGLRRIPSNSIHMTVLTLLPAHVGSAVDATWSSHRDWCIEAVGRLCATMKCFSIAMDMVCALETAIVLMTEQCGPLQDFRQRLVQSLASSGWPLRPPEIAHASLFRYEEPSESRQLLNELRQTVSVCARVTELLIVRELRYPSLETEIIRRFRFSE